MVNTLHTWSSRFEEIKDHQAVSWFLLLSSPKKWVLSIALLSVVLFGWNQWSPTSFNNAWLSKNQQAALYFHNGQYQEASALFKSTSWKGFSAYFAGDFTTAIEQLEEVKGQDVELLIANAFAHSGQFEKAQQLYLALYNNEDLSEIAKANYKVVSLAIEKIKNAPPEKSKNKTIDDRQIVSEETEEAKSDKTVILTDQIWLEQVRQDPSKFLRQKFQSEYANEQK